MNIENMTDEQKSVMLAKLVGWLYLHDSITGEWWLDGAAKLYDEWFYNPATREARVTPLDLYNPANMALAWRVLNWAGDNLPSDHVIALNDFWMRRDTYPYKIFMWYEQDAQRAWLDKILTLAIEAGMMGETS